MKAQTIILIYLGFFTVEYLFHQFLTLINLGYVNKRKGEVPLLFRAYIDNDTYRTAADYTLAKGKFACIERTFSAAFLLFIILTGMFGRLETLLLGAELPYRIHGIVYICIVSLLFRIISLPFSAYSRFVIEKRYGFNTMGPGLFFLDVCKGLVISAVIFFPLLYGLYFAVDAAGNLWWIIAFGGIALFQLLMTVLYPVVIAPLFNKFTPLEEGPLRDRLHTLADTLEFETSGIFIMDGSKRSRHSNAFFTGIGKVKRIVLFDTLLKQLKDEEIAAVLAHEIGHEKKRHTLKMYLVSMVLLGFGLYIIHLLLRWEPLFAAFGFIGASLHGVIIIVSLCAGPFTFLFTPLLTAWSRKFEYQADEYAAEGLKKTENPERSGEGTDPEALATGLITIHKKNLSNLTPHPLYSFYHYSHPTLKERLEALKTHLSV